MYSTFSRQENWRSKSSLQNNSKVLLHANWLSKSCIHCRSLFIQYVRKNSTRFKITMHNYDRIPYFRNHVAFRTLYLGSQNKQNTSECLQRSITIVKRTFLIHAYCETLGVKMKEEQNRAFTNVAWEHHAGKHT